MRDAGFSIFYISINIGGFRSIINGLIARKYGLPLWFWCGCGRYGVGLVAIYLGSSIVPATPAPFPLPQGKGKVAAGVAGAVVALLAVAVMAGWLNLGNFSKVLLATVIVATLVIFCTLIKQPCGNGRK